ncbi:P-loop containing nucleoside triphosphate hydrolase protein [Dactylonectria estremocensis]|uniref:P-loop containing nucleoside triphosphate hydrolase protein n=1 Tax=Dactylonectria estremocensis TaxID=1079267 RepID=A0A9P9JHY2_9HYPO|nr:P-loop containing nucleoside triphosphate hydrolase protein [Dactylonectria estremocensis]
MATRPFSRPDLPAAPCSEPLTLRDICAFVRQNVSGWALNIDLENLQHLVVSRAGTESFPSRDHRTVALIAGAAEELYHQRQREDKLFDTTIDACAFADDLSIVQPSDTDLSTYGIAMDGTLFQHQYVAVSLAGIRKACPDIGTRVSLYLQVPYTDHLVPSETIMSASQKLKVAQYLQFELNAAVGHAHATEVNCQRQLDSLRMEAKPNQEKINAITRKLRTISDEVFYRDAERFLFRFVKDVDPSSRAAFPDESVQRWHSANRLGARLLDWVNSQGAVLLPKESTEFGDAFPAMRIPLPHGVRADIALFSLSTPRQSNWMDGFRKPPARYDIPFTPLLGSLEATFRSLFDADGRGTSPTQTFQVRIWCDVPDTRIKAEYFAVTAMDNMPKGCRAAKWWDHIVDFSHPERIPSGNLLKAYPVLASRVTDEKHNYDEETAVAIKSLESTPAGFVAVNGCPGAGKSTWASEYDTSTVDPATFDEEISMLSKKCDDHGIWANATKAPGWNEADTGRGIAMPGTCTTTGSSGHKTGRIAWVTPSNKLAKVARSRLGERSKNKTIIHVLPWRREVANVLNDDAAPPPDADAAALSRATRQYVALATNHAKHRQRRWTKLNPAAEKNSLSEFAKSLLADSPEAFPEQVCAMKELADNPRNFNENRAENTAAMRTLLEYALGRADAIVGTPDALVQLSHRFPSWKPDLLVIDEAGKMSEASVFMPIAAFPEAPCFILGDPKPVKWTGNASDGDGDGLYGKQRKISLLDRLDAANAFNITLTTNWRSHGTVAEYAQLNIYQGMTMGHKRSQATKEMHRYMQTLGSASVEGTSMFIDVQNGSEERTGTSYSNPTNALIVRELAVQLFRDAPLRNMNDFAHQRRHDRTHPVRRGTIMILTAYANQKRYYETILDAISPAEIPEGHLSVRTIDSSDSAEADIVIVDLVRTSRPGFIIDPQRVAVITTSARLAQFFVGSVKAFEHANNVERLIGYLKQRQCLVTIKVERNGGRWCTHCHRPGHNVAMCRAAPRCQSCAEKGIASNHAIRDCNGPVMPTELWSTTIGMLDNIPRSISDFDKNKGVQQQKRKKQQGRQVQKKMTSAERRRGLNNRPADHDSGDESALND